MASLGDLSGDGVGDLAVLAANDDDGGAPGTPHGGAVWTLFLDGAFCSDLIRNGGEQCDDGNLADGDGCDHICQIEVQDSWGFSGSFTTGTVSFTVAGVAFQIPTFPGQTPGDVAASVAAAMNADPLLQQMDIFAAATGDTVISNALITDRVIIQDPTRVPVLTGQGLALLGLLLLLSATTALRSASQARA